jgi:hypothetical protein
MQSKYSTIVRYTDKTREEYPFLLDYEIGNMSHLMRDAFSRTVIYDWDIDALIIDRLSVVETNNCQYREWCKIKQRAQELKKYERSWVWVVSKEINDVAI